MGQVTISTNMAGRGTDILLGGNPDYMARLKLKELLLPKVVMTADEDIAFEKKGKKNIAPKKYVAPLPARALALYGTLYRTGVWRARWSPVI